MRRYVSVALVALMVTGASDSSAEPAAAGADSSIPPYAGPEIIVEGRRGNDKYRLPTQSRSFTLPAPDRRWAAAGPRLGCENVGPLGCGADLLRLIAVRGDGQIQIGKPKSGR